MGFHIDEPCRMIKDRYYPTWKYMGMLIQKPKNVYLIGPADADDDDGDLLEVWDMAEDLQTARWKIEMMKGNGEG